jgi:hypothetical protein
VTSKDLSERQKEAAVQTAATGMFGHACSILARVAPILAVTLAFVILGSGLGLYVLGDAMRGGQQLVLHGQIDDRHGGRMARRQMSGAEAYSRPDAPAARHARGNPFEGPQPALHARGQLEFGAPPRPIDFGAGCARVLQSIR